MKVRSVEHLSRLALERKSVTGLPWGRCSAAFLISMQAIRVLRYIRRGLFVYKPKVKR